MTAMIPVQHGLNAPENMVRLARPADSDQLWELARIMHTEHAYHAFPLSERRVRAELETSISRQDGMIGVIGDDVLEGAAWLSYGNADWYTEVRTLAERMVIVHPAFRRGIVRIKSLLAWIDCAQAHIGPMVVGVISNDRTDAKVRLYRRRFGEPAGVAHFWMTGGRSALGGRD